MPGKLVPWEALCLRRGCRTAVRDADGRERLVAAKRVIQNPRVVESERGPWRVVGTCPECNQKIHSFAAVGATAAGRPPSDPTAAARRRAKKRKRAPAPEPLYATDAAYPADPHDGRTKAPRMRSDHPTASGAKAKRQKGQRSNA
jgi:hypothetical protein